MPVSRIKEIFRKITSSWTFAVILAIAISLLFAIWVGPALYHIDGFKVGLSVAPALRGETELAIPPFGDVRAYTHSTPVRLIVTFDRIIPGEIKQIAGAIDNSDELVDEVERQSKEALRLFVLRLIFLAALGGAIGAALSPRRRRYKALAGCFIGLALMGSILGLTYRSYNIYAFKAPRYSGILTAAPWATEEVAKRLSDIKAFRKEVGGFMENINRFYSKMDSFTPMKGNEIAVLHVSDIHNNPLAIDIAHKLVKDFNIDLIIDTGDITDFGTPIETTLTQGIAKLPVPYIYIPGNHDSQASLDFMSAVPNVIVLNDKVKTIEGLRIYGATDPAAETMYDAVVVRTALDKLKTQLEESIATMSRPAIVAAHNPKIVEGITDKVPLILVGHTHKAGHRMRDSAVVDNAGTSGGAGVRSIMNNEDVPYTFKIIHIDRNTKQLVAIDSIELTGTEQEFRLERNLIEGNSPAQLE